MPSAQNSRADSPVASLSELVGELAGTIGSQHFPNADRAALKRMDRSQAPPLAFYRFAVRHLPENWQTSREGWLAIVQGMALMSPQIHRPGLALGRALAELNYSEARLERLLSASEEVERTLILRAVRFLAAKKVATDWCDLARLLLTRDRHKREHVRMAVATDFYRSLKSKE